MKIFITVFIALVLITLIALGIIMGSMLVSLVASSWSELHSNVKNFRASIKEHKFSLDYIFIIVLDTAGALVSTCLLIACIIGISVLLGGI